MRTYRILVAGFMLTWSIILGAKFGIKYLIHDSFWDLISASGFGAFASYWGRAIYQEKYY